MSGRLIAVLGYSRGGTSLHEICAARLERAESVTRPEDVVLLSGWAHSRGVRSEAELMAAAWQGPSAELVLAPDARTTLGNAHAAADAALRLGVEEVVLVTSRWHEPRASALFRAALRGTGIRLVLAPAEGNAARRTRWRETLCWLLVPAQGALAGRRTRRTLARHGPRPAPSSAGGRPG